MQNMRRTTATLLLLLIGVSAGLIAADKKHKKPAATAQMDDSRRALHALNRLTFGPRPGDVQRVTAIGVDKWIDQQLHPEKIDDSALDARLSGFRTLHMNAEQMVQNFPPPQALKAVATGRQPLPRDAEKRAIYEDAVEKYRDKKDKKAQTNPVAPPASGVQGGEAADAGTTADVDPNAMTDDQRAEIRAARQHAREQVDQILALPADQRMNAILRMPPENRIALAQVLNNQDREKIAAAFTPEQMETLRALVNPQSVVVSELQQAKVLRAAYSDRQLDEVMTDFWFNHFNVFLNKGADRYLTTEYEHDAIRAHALGKFKDLLVATAKSPAMLFYLDNWQSVGPHSFASERGPRARNGQFRRQNAGMKRRGFPGFPGMPPLAQQRPPRNPNQTEQNGQPAPPKPSKKAGLNENYGRELMELHTLGVDGGYTQKDVTEVAKVFTGWTIKQPRRGGAFDFNPRMHEPGPKYVLGHEIKESGESEGMQVLDLLAHHPSTAKFIARKLAMRFVSDNPPQALVDRMAATFESSDGDIREVLRTLFRSPEFWAPEAYRAKVKTPLEFVASAIRATGVDVRNAMPLVQTLNQLGMPLYQMQPPTGYSMKAEAWVNSAALLGRMNFALRLASGRLPGTAFDSQTLLAAAGGGPPSAGMSQADTAESALPQLEQALLAGDISKQTHDTIVKQLENPDALVQQINRPPQPGAREPETGAPASMQSDDLRAEQRAGKRNRPARQAAFTGPAPTRVNLIAGLLLGSPEFQRK